MAVLWASFIPSSVIICSKCASRSSASSSKASSSSVPESRLGPRPLISIDKVLIRLKSSTGTGSLTIRARTVPTGDSVTGATAASGCFQTSNRDESLLLDAGAPTGGDLDRALNACSSPFRVPSPSSSSTSTVATMVVSPAVSASEASCPISCICGEADGVSTILLGAGEPHRPPNMLAGRHPDGVVACVALGDVGGEATRVLAELPMLGLCRAFEKLFATVPIRANHASEMDKVTSYSGPL